MALKSQKARRFCSKFERYFLWTRRSFLQCPDISLHVLRFHVKPSSRIHHYFTRNDYADTAICAVCIIFKAFLPHNLFVKWYMYLKQIPYWLFSCQGWIICLNWWSQNPFYALSFTLGHRMDFEITNYRI